MMEAVTDLISWRWHSLCSYYNHQCSQNVVKLVVDVDMHNCSITVFEDARVTIMHAILLQTPHQFTTLCRIETSIFGVNILTHFEGKNQIFTKRVPKRCFQHFSAYELYFFIKNKNLSYYHMLDDFLKH